MKKDIQFPRVDNVFITIVEENGSWRAYLLNRRPEKLKNVMITSKGYGEADGEKQNTSILRHVIPEVDAGEYAMIEPITEEVFHLNNEYWVSFFVDDQIYDKKYIFVPDSIREENLSFIEELNARGVLHQ